MSTPWINEGTGFHRTYDAMRQGGQHRHDDGAPGDHDHPDLADAAAGHGDRLDVHSARLDGHDDRLAELEAYRREAKQV